MNDIPITKEELSFMEIWYTPKALLEILFHDWDNLNAFHPGKFGSLRLYQYSMLSDESIIDFELTAEQLNLDVKQTFQLKKRVGDIYNFGARKFGKSRITMIMDMICQMMTSFGEKAALGSIDLIHIKEVLDPVKMCLETHKVCSIFKRRITGAPDFKIELKNDYVLNSVNANVGSKNPGSNYLGKHVYRLYVEEASLETEDVYEKRKDAISELGCVYRISGMTDFTPQSPAGQAFYSAENHKHVLNYPQAVSPFWDEKERKERIEKYGGANSVGFRVYALGEVVEDGLTAFDMQRVRAAAIREHKTLQIIEITKDRFKHFKNFCIVVRPPNSERIFISSDIGLNVTEINIISEVAGQYEYLYNITLNNLIDDEQSDIFKFLIQTLQANVIAIDCGDGMGRAIYNELEKTVPIDNLVWYAGTNKIKIGFMTDKEGNVLFENGKPIIKEEFMSEWAVKRLKDLLYSGNLIIPEDFKFITQIQKVVAFTVGTRVTYKCVSQLGDHLFDSFRVFAIAEWIKANANLTPNLSEEWGCGANN